MNIPLKISKKKKTTTHAKDQTRQCEQHVYVCKSEQKFCMVCIFFMLDILTIRNSFITVNITVSHY